MVDDGLLQALAGIGYVANEYRVLQEVEATYEAAMESAEELESEDNDPFDIIYGNAETLRDISSYFIFISNVAESYMQRLVYLKIVDSENVSEDLQNDLPEVLDYHDCLTLLHSAGCLDDGHKGELTKLRRIRNKFAHDREARLGPGPIDTPTTEIDRGYRAIGKLVEIEINEFGFEY
jgi:uncharacterized protein YutE (UPF0331/DUF86 family)